MHQKGFISLAFIAVVLLLVAFGGYIGWSKKTNNVDTANTVLPLTSGMEDSKTYANSQYNFEVQIPADWHVTVDQSDTSVSFDSPQNFKIVEEGKKRVYSEGSPSNITFIYYDDITKEAKNQGITLKSKTLEEYVALSEDTIFFDSQKISFAGQTAFRGQEAGLYNMDAIWLQKGNHLYKIWLQSNVGMDVQLSNYILSTFKFTEPIIKVNTLSVSQCLPSGIKLSGIVSADLTVEQKLISLNARCTNGKLFDSSNKEIYFYHLTGCWGNPPENYQEILQRQQEEINTLKEKYVVIEMTCNQFGVQIQ